MIGHVITLTPEEITRGRNIAYRWRIEQQRAFGGRDRGGVIHTPMGDIVNRQQYRRYSDNVTLGVLGEMAVAKHLGIPWSGENPFDPTDVGPYQVRTHRHEDSPLILQQYADPNDLYILVTLIPNGRRMNLLNIVGWITVREARVSKYWTEPDWRHPEREPSWRVPQRDLHPMETLPPWPPSSAQPSPQTDSASAVAQPK